MAFKKIIMKKKEICCIGAGYVGGPTMSVIASKCPDYNITVVDVNKDRIDQWNGDIDNLPIYEPGLKEIVYKHRNDNLFFSDKVDDAIKNSSIIFIAVNTPTIDHGEGKGMATDLTYIEECAKRIAKISSSNKIIVEKSTAPIGTAQKIKKVLSSNKKVKFEIISNPEFLAEGTAIDDLQDPDRVLIGGDNTPNAIDAINEIVKIYSHWVKKEKIITTNLWSSELSKLASNAFLAQRVSSINSLSALCEVSGASIKEVSRAVGADKRIGDKFLVSSIGFGGSCFKKDILNLVYLCKYYGLDEVSNYWYNVIKINDYQKSRFVTRIIKNLDGSIENKIISILGWAFKKDTNDSRESASIDVAAYLLNNGAYLKIYDPMVNIKKIKEDLALRLNQEGYNDNEIKLLLKKVKILKNMYDTIEESDCISFLTEWDEFKQINWKDVKRLVKGSLFVADGRNIFDFESLNGKVDNYISIGTPNINHFDK